MAEATADLRKSMATSIPAGTTAVLCNGGMAVDQKLGVETGSRDEHLSRPIATFPTSEPCYELPPETRLELIRSHGWTSASGAAGGRDINVLGPVHSG